MHTYPDRAFRRCRKSWVVPRESNPVPWLGRDFLVYAAREEGRVTQVFVYDTTLRDGTQGEHISLTVEDKLRIARRLDEFGIDYIEGGWPGSNPKDSEFFERARELNLTHAKLSAFGSTRRAGVAAADDEGLKTLLAA